MYNKNIFTQKDPIADAISQIAEADYKAKMEELKGNQKVLDKNKNNKLDADDFKILRGEKKAVKEESEKLEEGLLGGGYTMKMKHEHKYRIHAPDGKHVGDVTKEEPGAGWRHHAGGSKWDGTETSPHYKTGVSNNVVDAAKKVVQIHKASLNESTNPFSKDYKSQIPTKPGEKAGFDSKKISTGTVYSKKHKPEPAEKEVKEETEQVDEASYSAKAARAGKDIGKPGKMFKKIAKGAAARYGSMARGKKVAGAVLAKLRKEETDYEPLLIDQITEDTMSTIEQLDELKKATVKSYIAKKMDKIYSAKKAPDKKKAKKDTESLQRAHERAVGNKPTSEEVEQIDERTLTAGETAKKERIVKGMKKNLAGFKKRYGERAKSVMYATATARAKK